MPVVTGTGPGMERMRHAGMGVGLVALVLAGTAACGSSNDVGTAAAAQLGSKTTSNSASDTSSTSSQAERDKRAKEFTACMRSNGVEDFPGITIQADGTVKLALNGKGVDPISAEYKRAAKTCGELLPAGSPLPNDPTLQEPSAPAVENLSCSGDYCPKPPEEPELPS